MIEFKRIVLVLTIALLVKAKQPIYTEDVRVFKNEQFNARMELVVGCWLYAKQYLEQYPEKKQEFQGVPFEKLEVSIVRKCLKNIKRKDAINKMASLVDPSKEPKHSRKLLDIIGIVASQDISKDTNELQQFLKPYLKKHRQDLVQIQKKGLKQQIEKMKNKKKLFGIIDLGSYSPTSILIIVTVVIVGIFTYVRYRNRMKEMDAGRGARRRNVREE